MCRAFKLFALISFCLILPSNAAHASDYKMITDFQKYFGGRKLSASELVPTNFRKAASARGDFNADDIPDMAIIIEEAPPKDYEVGIEGYEVVLLLFTGDKDGTYTFWKSATSQVSRVELGEDVKDDNSILAIRNGVLYITSHSKIPTEISSEYSFEQRWIYYKGDLRLQSMGFGAHLKNGGNKAVAVNYVNGDIAEISQLPGRHETVNKSEAKPQVITWEKYNPKGFFDKYKF